MKRYNIMVFPGGSEIGLEIHRSLCFCKEVSLFSVAMDIPNHAPFVFKNHFIIPSIHSSNWIEKLNEVIAENKIDYIFPAYDDVIVALAENADKIKCRVILPPMETCRITRSKSATYHHFAGIIPCPKIFTDNIADSDFPLFVKPDKGQGSENSYKVTNRRELEFVLAKDKTAITLEYLPGEEITVDCFSDRENGLLFCGGRKRIRTKSGISMACAPIQDSSFRDFALLIQKHLEIFGAWFFQLKRDQSGSLKLLEIAPRIAGTMAFHRVLGINFPLLSIYEQERLPVSILSNSGEIRIERALKSRFSHKYSFSTVYIDLDDTVILKGAVNPVIIQFIFQCINKKIPVYLITKHEGDLTSTLEKYRISGIFDKIIHLKKEEEKAAYFVKKDAILIDDSFSERLKANRISGIMTFDSSMVDILIDEQA